MKKQKSTMPDVILLNDSKEVDISNVTEEESYVRRGRLFGTSFVTIMNNKSKRTQCIIDITTIYQEELHKDNGFL
jgi:hypothetical protein